MSEPVSAPCADIELVLEAAWPLLYVVAPVAGTDPIGTTVGAASTLFNLQRNRHQLLDLAKAVQTQCYRLEALHDLQPPHPVPISTQTIFGDA